MSLDHHASSGKEPEETVWGPTIYIPASSDVHEPSSQAENRPATPPHVFSPGRVPWGLGEDQTVMWSNELSSPGHDLRQYLPESSWLGGAMTAPHREGYEEDFGPSFSRAARPMLAKLEQDLEEAEAYLKLAHPPAARMDSSSRIKVRERLYAQACSVAPRPQPQAQPSRWEGAPSPYKDTRAYGRALWEKTSPKKGLQGRGGLSATARTLPDWAGKTLEEMEKRTSSTPYGPCGKFIPCGPCGPDPGSRMAWFPRSGSDEDFLPPAGGWGNKGHNSKNKRIMSANAMGVKVPSRHGRANADSSGPWNAAESNDMRPATSPR